MVEGYGEVQEWLNWPLSKSGEPQGSEGSNPSLSAKKNDAPLSIIFLASEIEIRTLPQVLY
jgi:hypothetical protein